MALLDEAERGEEELERALLRRAKGGDRDAFVLLMDRYDRRLRSLAYRLLDDREEAIEAMQDVYVKAFGALSGFKERAAVGTWLYRITYTTCCEQLRRQRRRPVIYTDEELTKGDGAQDPAEEAVLHADLVAALRSLSPEARAAVLMVDRDGFDYRTTARTLGIPVGTLASRLSAAHAVLRQALHSREAAR